MTSGINVVLHGAKLLLRALYRSVVEEVELSQAAARCRYLQRENRIISRQEGRMSLSEATKILNVECLKPEEVEKQYKHLFNINDKQNGGSYYLQAKIRYAKDVLDSEMAREKKSTE